MGGSFQVSPIATEAGEEGGGGGVWSTAFEDEKTQTSQQATDKRGDVSDNPVPCRSDRRERREEGR